MRISTIQAFNTGVRGIQDNYSAVTRTQEQITSGKRVLTPADDPVASVRLLQLDQQASKLAQYKDNLTAATSSLNQEEAILNSVNNVLQRVREITLEAGNGALDAGGRQALAQELAEREDELHGLLNSQNARGEYLFGGFQSDTQPFVKSPNGSYTYAGDEGQRSIQIGSAKMVAINDNGKALFVDVANVTRLDTAVSSGSGNISLGRVENETLYNTEFPRNGISIAIQVTANDPDPDEPDSPVTYSYSYTIKDAEGNIVEDAAGEPIPNVVMEPNAEGRYEVSYAGMAVTLSGDLADGDEFTVKSSEKRSVLDTVRLLRDTLENTDDSADGKHLRGEALSVSLQNLDNAMNKVLGVQTSLGARLNIIESTQLENDEASLINTTVQSGLEDLDYAEALSRLSMESIVLQAAQQSFVKVSGLSLFNFLR